MQKLSFSQDKHRHTAVIAVLSAITFLRSNRGGDGSLLAFYSAQFEPQVLLKNQVMDVITRPQVDVVFRIRQALSPPSRPTLAGKRKCERRCYLRPHQFDFSICLFPDLGKDHQQREQNQ